MMNQLDRLSRPPEPAPGRERAAGPPATAAGPARPAGPAWPGPARSAGPADRRPGCSRARVSQVATSSGVTTRANQQGNLRGQLGEFMKKLDENGMQMPESAGPRRTLDARGRAEALRRGDPREAGRSQRRALDNLQQGMGDMAEQMRQARTRQRPGHCRDRGARGSAARTAIRWAAPTATSAIRSIPKASTRCRSSSTARRAARSSTSCAAAPGEQQRPKEELDYIDRLLKTY